MSLKAELETWAAALQAYDDEDFEKSLDMFSRIADSSKILTNMGLIYATLGEHEAAVEQFTAATGLDNYLAVAVACPTFSLVAMTSLPKTSTMPCSIYEETRICPSSLLPNPLLRFRSLLTLFSSNYTQLGLTFTLYSAEVLFNKGLSLIYLGQVQEGMGEFDDAAKQKATAEHDVIDEAIRDRGEGYTVFSIPVGVLYRPSENKLRNAKTRDFLGKAKLVASENPSEAYTSFTGVTRLRAGVTPGNVLLDPDASQALLNRSASTSIKGPDLDVQPMKGLQRAQTTINVPSNARERMDSGKGNNTSPTSPPDDGIGTPVTPGLGRVNTTGGPRGPGLAGAAMMRGPSMRKGGGDAPAPPTKEKSGGARMTEFYDSFVDSYADSAPPPPPIPTGGDRVAAWARSAGGAPPPSARAPSSYGGSARSGTLKRRGTRRTMATSVYDEDEEGYVTGSGEWDEMFELTKIRVKIHFEDDVRGMALDPTISFAEFLQRVADKFETTPRTLKMKFRDEDGGKVSLRDESDYELAIETARESAKGKPEGKLEIWCESK